MLELARAAVSPIAAPLPDFSRTEKRGLSIIKKIRRPTLSRSHLSFSCTSRKSTDLGPYIRRSSSKLANIYQFCSSNSPLTLQNPRRSFSEVTEEVYVCFLQCSRPLPNLYRSRPKMGRGKLICTLQCLLPLPNQLGPNFFTRSENAEPDQTPWASK